MSVIGEEMVTDGGDTDAERADLWGRLDEVLPGPVRILRDALQRRVLSAPGDPLRNRLIRKLLVGVYDPVKLIAQFENGAAMLRNWNHFVGEVAMWDVTEFDTRLWPWLAELRALDFLRNERGAETATFVRRARKYKTPDFIVHRKVGDGLAEVKLVTPNDNFDTVQNELEIAAIRWPDVFDRRLYEVETLDDRQFALSTEPDALAAFIEKIRDAVKRRKRSVLHAWLTADGRPCQLTARIRRYKKFVLIGQSVDWRRDGGVRGLLDDEFRQHWLSPFAQRLAEKGHEALMQMRAYEARRGTPYTQKDIVIYYQEPAGSGTTLLLSDDVNSIKATVTACLRGIDPGATLAIRS